MRVHFRFVLLSALIVTCLDAAPVQAIGVPSPDRSIVPNHIVLVGLSGDMADTELGEFVVKVRDLADNPWPGANVVIDFISTADVRVAAVQPDPNLIVNCIAPYVQKIADAQGEARFTIVGAGAGVFNPGSTRSLVRIYAVGTHLATVPVHTHDLDGQEGLGAGDLSLFINEFITGNGSWAADYDGSQALSAGDLSLWLTAFGKGTQTSSPAAVCP